MNSVIEIAIRTSTTKFIETFKLVIYLGVDLSLKAAYNAFLVLVVFWRSKLPF